MAFLCNNPGGNGCFSGIIVVLSGHDGGRTRRPGYVRRGTVTTQEFETAGVKCENQYRLCKFGPKVAQAVRIDKLKFCFPEAVKIAVFIYGNRLA